MKKIIRSFMAMLLVMTMVLGECPVGVGMLPELSKVEAASTLQTVNEADVRARVKALAQAMGCSADLQNSKGKLFTANGKACGHVTAKKYGSPSTCENCRVGYIVQQKPFPGLEYPAKQEYLPGHYGVETSFSSYNSYTCAGFVNYALWYISRQDSNSDVTRKLLGKQGQTFKKANLEASGIRIGDVVRIDGQGHSAMFLGYNGDKGIKVLSSNWVSGDKTSINVFK